MVGRRRSLLLALGVPPHVVREIAGHSDIKVTVTVYAHGHLAEKAAALTQLGTTMWGRCRQRLPSPAGRRSAGPLIMPVSCGSGGIRTPGPSRDSRFQGECIRPLCHASAGQPSRSTAAVAASRAPRRRPSGLLADPIVLRGPQNLRDDALPAHGPGWSAYA